MELIPQLAAELNIRQSQVQSAVELIDAGNTIPFIARYRKEATGGLDDTQLRELHERLAYLRGLAKRKEEVSAAITEQGKMTDALQDRLKAALTLAEVEDLYRPYRPKRRTRASTARERGLEPLAALLLQQNPADDPQVLAGAYISPEKELPDAQAALQGAMDILAEEFSDDADLRSALRAYLRRTGEIKSTGSSDKPSVYSMYFEFAEPVRQIAGYRVLAIDRGEAAGELKVSIQADREAALALLLNRVLKKPATRSGALVQAAAEDSYDRLIFPSLEREIRSWLTEQACDAAIRVFSVNLRNLLMQPPVRGSVTLGLDPAYRTGCKIAVVDDTGKVLATTVVYPTPPQNKTAEAERILTELIERYQVTTIAIGNGTASRESELFVAQLIKKQAHPVSYMVVSEAGASVYSASKLAAEEFPTFDVSLRSAVSIARRLQDPLAELVKIDPKAIGVGQYQHDMPKAQLGEALGGVVESCVNTVGVDLNTASHSLLSYVAGINASIAKNIVTYREQNGSFTRRQELLKVPKLGKKAFEQCAGFLRIPGGSNILDNTAVHPESYEAAKQLLTLCGYSLQELSTGLQELPARVAQQGEAALASRIGVGVPTLHDMVQELLRPGRDPRESLPKPLLRTDVMKMEDLKPGMVLSGTVRNVIDFGAFVDIGVHQDGLVHISRLSERFVKHPSQVVKVGDVVAVKVVEIDLARKRIGLSMRDITPEEAALALQSNL